MKELSRKQNKIIKRQKVNDQLRRSNAQIMTLPERENRNCRKEKVASEISQENWLPVEWVPSSVIFQTIWNKYKTLKNLGEEKRCKTNDQA